MGRKLNALEVIQASITDSSEDRRECRAQLRQQYLERIANTLGITTAQLSEAPTLPGAVQIAIDLTRESELVLNQQCRDLVEAFIQIQNPQNRLRCLQIVRDAAGLKSSRSSC